MAPSERDYHGSVHNQTTHSVEWVSMVDQVLTQANRPRDRSKKGIQIHITPTSAKQIVEHLRGGGRCLVTSQVRYGGRMGTTHPRDIEQFKRDSNGEWWFGVSMFAFQWFKFPSEGLVWALV